MILSVLRTVFRRPRYIALMLLVGASIFLVATLLPNVALMAIVFESSDIGWVQKVMLVVSLIESIATNFTVFSAASIILIAVLTGINVSLVTYLLRRNLEYVRGSGATVGMIGAVSGLLGIGCAACGSFLVLNAAAIFGAASLVMLLPLKGGEFSIISIALLIIAIILMVKKIARPSVCAVK